MSAYLLAELANWPTKESMIAILRAAGFNLYVGRYSIRIEDFQQFSFEVYGGDIGEPCIEAVADTVEEMTRQGRLVSDALSRAGVRHRFEIYNERDELSAYLHHEWLLEGSAEQDGAGNSHRAGQ